MSFLNAIEFKVGAMVVAVGSLIAVMSMQVSDNPTFFSRNQKAWFLIPNAAGLIKGSAIKSAGIPVGTISSIKLQDGQARVDIQVKKDVPLTTSAAVELKSNGILGDKYVEVYPGSPTDPPLPDGAQILNVKDKGSMDSVIASVGEVTDSLKSVAEALKEAVSEDGTRKHVLGRIMLNIEKLTADIAQMTDHNKGKIDDIIEQVHGITGTLDELINDESDQGFKKTWKSLMVRVDSISKNIDEVAAKVNDGKGAIGKLISDEDTGDELASAITGVNDLLGAANRTQMAFDFNGTYLNSVKASKSYIGVRIQPGLDRYYELAVIDDPAGVVKLEGSRSGADADNLGASSVVEKTFYNETKFTALYAKNFWDWTVKGGLIESSGGMGVDYHLFHRRLRLSAEAFDFGKTQLRASARMDLTHGLYLTGGLSDALDKKNARSAYVGAGLFLTNDDLKLLLSGSFLK